jgi:tetratricopeptide (TPR) repeat protein
MHNASTLLQSGKFAQARSVLETILRNDPNMIEAHRLLAGAMLALGDRHTAEKTLRAAAAINPRWAPIQVALGELLVGDGRLDEAERALRNGVTDGANYPRASLSLASLLLQTNRQLEARNLIAPFAMSSNATPEVLSEYANALNALEQYDDAAEILARVSRMMPKDGVIAARLASAQASAGRYAQAKLSAQRALENGADFAQTWFAIGHAAMGEARFDDAETAFRTACDRDPQNVDAQRELAQLIWMRHGDLAMATQHLDLALRMRPNSEILLSTKAVLYESAGDDVGALELLRESAQQDSAHPAVLLTASEAAMKANMQGAVEYAERALRKLPGDTSALAMLGNALLNAGRAQEAEALALEALRRHPYNQGFIALFATARRLRGDERYREIHDYAGLVHTWTIDTPSGWLDLPSYLADLAESLREMHTLRTHPVHQSLRHGTQSTKNLLESEDPVIRAFFSAIDGPIQRHMRAIGKGNDPTRQRNTGGYKIRGIWSVQLHPNGYHTNHVHPDGWLSSACYIDLPPAIEHDHQGWLKFGEPGIPTQPPLAPEHFVRPAPGLLALFPSHMWHGTVPFTGEGTRLTIAFDVVPA